MRGAQLLLPALVLLVGIAPHAVAESSWLDLPTENRGLFEGKPGKFYMHVERDFEGKKSKPLEGGMYGFTRNPRRVNGAIVFTRFHEGIDIAPLRRDAAGKPLDPVVAAADGEVVHVSASPRDSNYGIYAVIAHGPAEERFYTLYAHLGSVGVLPGRQVRRGEKIGVLGYTGAGINRERAHLHFEIAMLLSENFERWHARHFPADPNKHGLFNGMNLAGLDPSGYLLALRKDPTLSIPAFLSKTKPLYQITLNHSENFDLVRLNPWLVAPGTPAAPPAWRITFNSWMVPIRAEAVPGAVAEPVVEWLGPASPPLPMQTQDRIAGTAEKPVLTASGRRFLDLLSIAE